MQNSTSLGYALIIARGSTAQTGTSTAPSSCRAAAPKLNRLQRARPDTGSGEISKPLLFAAKQIPPGTLPWRTCANLADAQADSQATSSPPARHLRATNFPESLEPQTRRKQQPYHTRRARHRPATCAANARASARQRIQEHTPARGHMRMCARGQQPTRTRVTGVSAWRSACATLAHLAPRRTLLCQQPL